MLPNKEFWRGVPSLVKDGARFTFEKIVGTRVKWATLDKYETL